MKTVILIGLAFSLLISNSNSFAQGTEVAPGVLMIGTIQSADISESSGIAPSRRGKGLFWTHNDSGADMLYAMTPAGEVTGSYKLKDTELQNWEDIVSAPGRVYAADIGNNSANRNSVNIYALPEPNPRRSGEVKPLRTWKLEYPDHPFDAESFFLSKGYGYVIQKESGNAHVFRFKLNGRGTDRTLEEQCKLNLGAPAAGADITADNKRLAVITSSGAYLFALPKKVPSSGTLEPALFVPFTHDQMEGCAFTRDGLIVTAENRDIFLFNDPQFRLKTGARVLP